MNSGTPNRPKTPRWKLAAELLFVAWVIVINFLYYAQFKDLVIRHLGSLFRR